MTTGALGIETEGVTGDGGGPNGANGPTVTPPPTDSRTKTLTSDTADDERAMRTIAHVLGLIVVLLALYVWAVGGSWAPESVRRILENEGVTTALISLVYLTMLLIARVLFIARPYRKALQARVERVRGRQRLLKEDDTRSGNILTLLEAADQRLQRSDSVLWSWGDQAGAFELISQAEDMMAGSITAGEARLRLDVVLSEMDRYRDSSPHVADVQRRFEATLIELTREIEPSQEAQLMQSGAARLTRLKRRDIPDRMKALHSNALQALHTLQLDEFARILKWHRKVLWLTIIGLGLATLLAATLGNALLLLLGGTGAYVARLGRIIKRSDTQPEDPSSYWTNLLLGPVLGALAAYGGVLLIGFLSYTDLIGGGLKDVEFVVAGEAPRTAAALTTTMAVAFLLGVSEGLINRITGVGEGAIVGKADPSEMTAGTSITEGPDQ